MRPKIGRKNSPSIEGVVKGLAVHRFLYIGKFFGELFAFAKQNKAWWIVPMVIVLLLLGSLIITGQAVAPFIYTLF